MWPQRTPASMERRSNDDHPVAPSKPESTPAPTTSQAASQSTSSPSVVRAGQLMLIFSLLLIFMVACCVTIHLVLRSRKRKAKKSGTWKDKMDKKKKKKSRQGKTDGPPELFSREKDIAELVGTPICEIGESEPRHEMEDIEVQKAITPMEEPIGSAFSTFGSIAIPVTLRPEPEVREFASYWSMRL